MTKNQDIRFSYLACERAIDELRRQSGIVVTSDTNGFGNYPIEFINESLLAELRSPHLKLLITAARAQSLGWAARDTAIPAAALSLPQLMAIADPLAQGTLPEVTPAPASPIDSLALMLAKSASLLPALLRVEAKNCPSYWLRLDAEDIRRYRAQPLLDVFETAEANLPIAGAEHSRIIGFRSCYGTAVHLALIVGEPGDTPLTRIHSSCVTGDLLGSLRCDCGDQLAMALAQIREHNGILIYLHQEGRGIGITNKLRAYRLQEQGHDTYHANRLLGFGEDERDFAIAAAILKKLSIRRIRLLTNNPRKLTELEKSGITVSERVPLIAPSGQHNHDYLSAKGKAGHWF